MTEEQWIKTVGLNVNDYTALDVLRAMSHLDDRYDALTMANAWLEGDGETLKEFEDELLKAKTDTPKESCT
jgi:hypothetical protein